MMKPKLTPAEREAMFDRLALTLADAFPHGYILITMAGETKVRDGDVTQANLRLLSSVGKQDAHALFRTLIAQLDADNGIERIVGEVGPDGKARPKLDS
jgi:nicotinamide mononucleotide (NMN) deamidase PncC